MATSDRGPAQLVEPTVLGAMRRHWGLVVGIVLASVAAALAYDALSPKEYRATVNLSAPRPDGQAPVKRSVNLNLSVLDVAGAAWPTEHRQLAGARDRLLVVDCPPPVESARAVDLLAHCDTAVVLVRADEPVRQHLDLARWLELTETPVIGCVYLPRPRRGPSAWMVRRESPPPSEPRPSSTESPDGSSAEPAATTDEPVTRRATPRSPEAS
jgi:hypothetical protein